MKKLTEMTGWEAMSALAELAEPVGNLANDDLVWDTFVECTKRGVALRRNEASMRFLLQTYAKMTPVLLSDEHRRDTFKILSVIEGKPIDELMAMPAPELWEDIKKAYTEALMPFFLKAAHSGRRGSSSR